MSKMVETGEPEITEPNECDCVWVGTGKRKGTHKRQHSRFLMKL